MDELLNSNLINIGIFVAIIVAVIIWILLQKTTFGYEIKACGYNRDASQYAGISAKRNIIYSFIISGALAGLGGGLYYLSGNRPVYLPENTAACGFQRDSRRAAGELAPHRRDRQRAVYQLYPGRRRCAAAAFVRENIDIIIGVIIYVSAFALLLKIWFGKLFMRRTFSAAYACGTTTLCYRRILSNTNVQGEDGEDR